MSNRLAVCFYRGHVGRYSGVTCKGCWTAKGSDFENSPALKKQLLPTPSPTPGSDIPM